MSLKKTEQIGTNQYLVTFDADRAAFDAAITKVFKKASRNITIPGFRRGKAPRSIVEKMYGKEVFYEDAVNEILPAAYEDAIKDFEKTIVSRPEFDIDTIDENGVVITAKFFVKPDVAISDYLGIPVTRKVTPVTDKDIEDEIDRVRNRNARLVEVTDRPAQNDDIANINYEGFVDGVPFDGGKAENHDLKLGSGQFIPGFEDQIVGHSTGDEFDVNVTFPEEYHASDLAGKAAVFKCKLNAIKFNELPELDDEFARDVSEFDTLDEYKSDIKAKLEERNNKSADAEVEEQLIAALIEKLDAEIPEAMFENETENFVRDYDTRLRMQGLDLSTYFKYTGMNLDTLRTQMRPDAERQVKSRLALEKIAELEKIAVSDEEIEAEYARLAESYGMEVDKVKEAVEKSALEDDLKVKKAVDLIKEKAVVSEAAKIKADDSAKEEKPAAKTSARKTTTTKKTTSTKSSTAKTASSKTKSATTKTTASKAKASSGSTAAATKTTKTSTKSKSDAAKKSDSAKKDESDSK